MEFTTVWQELRDRCTGIGDDEVLVTPNSERPFDVDSFDEERIVVTYLRGEEPRSLWRDQFEVLYDRLAAAADGLSLADLPAGVEPYVAVMSLAPQYVVDESAGRLRRADESETTDSPYRRPAWTARTSPERVHDDALLLVDVLERTAEGVESLSPAALVDRYVLLSDVERGAGRLRREVGDRVLDFVGPDDRLHGRFGTVHRTRRERRRLKDEETVFEVLDESDVPREWVLGIDPEKLDVVLAVADIDERAVYDVDEQVYAQKTAVEEEEKQSRLQGLRDRLDGVESDEAAELWGEIREIEDRIDAVLAAG